MRVLRAVVIAVAVAAVLLAAGAPVLAQRVGIYKNHYGIYTSRPRRTVLPWQQPGAVSAPAPPAARPARSRPATGSSSPLPWKRSTQSARPAAATGLVKVPTGLVPVPTGHAWSTFPYLYPYGARWPVYVSPRWSGTLYGHVGGVRVWWGCGRRFGGKGFIFSTRHGLAAYRSGRLGFSVRW